MATRTFNIDEIVEILVSNNATKEEQYNFCHTWWGWVSKGVLHITSQSGARARDIWHFGLKEKAGSTLFLKNTTGIADCWTTRPAHAEKDPYERILRMCKVSKKALIRHQIGEEKTFSGSWGTVGNHVPNACSEVPVLNSKSQVEWFNRHERPNSHYVTEDWSVTIPGHKGSYLVIVQHLTDRNATITTTIKELHIWGAPDVQLIDNICCGNVYGRGASTEYLLAKEQGKLSEFVNKKVHKSDKIGYLIIDDTEYEFNSSGVETNRRTQNVITRFIDESCYYERHKELPGFIRDYICNPKKVLERVTNIYCSEEELCFLYESGEVRPLDNFAPGAYLPVAILVKKNNLTPPVAGELRELNYKGLSEGDWLNQTKYRGFLGASAVSNRGRLEYKGEILFFYKGLGEEMILLKQEGEAYIPVQRELYWRRDARKSFSLYVKK